MKKVLLTFLILVCPMLALASGPAVHLDDPQIDLNDKLSLQRGAKLFTDYCLNCHAAAYMRFNRAAKDLDMTEEQLKELLLVSDKPGDTMTVPNDPLAIKRWFGTVPPDLSVIARSRGPEWLYTYLRSFYADESRPFGVNNTVFKDVGMPHVLAELQGVQRAVFKTSTSAGGQQHQVIDKLELAQPGLMTPAQYDAAIKDLVGYLVYMGEPAKLQRYTLGVWVVVFLIVLTILLYLLKREYWRDVH